MEHLPDTETLPDVELLHDTESTSDMEHLPDAECSNNMKTSPGGLKVVQDDKEEFADLVAFKVYNLMQSTPERNEYDKSLFAETLDNESIFCIPCTTHAKSPDMPTNLRNTRKGLFGFFKKDKKNLNYNTKMHINSPTHAWCVKYKLSKAKRDAEEKIKNITAGTLLVTNAMFCFKNFGSANDWVKLNEKDNLTSGLQHSVATKNDGGQWFFKIRDLVFDTLTSKTKNFICDNIFSLAVTLDKVTVGHITYNVICSVLLAGFSNFFIEQSP